MIRLHAFFMLSDAAATPSNIVCRRLPMPPFRRRHLLPLGSISPHTRRRYFTLPDDMPRRHDAAAADFDASAPCFIDAA